jgi:hypothetical protein
MLAGPLLLFGLICAAVMGYAIQRGGTCLVAAIDEVVTKRRASKLIALLEAGLWVTGGLMIAGLASGFAVAAANYAVTAYTILGGALLGLGALINRACVFGSIARLGSGDWAYVLTPIGFYLGCLAASPLVGHPGPSTVSSPLLSAAGLLLAPFALFALWRGFGTVRALREKRFAAHIWAPHQATMVIGLAFLAMMLTVGNWAYTEALAELASGMAEDTLAKLILFAGLLGGALLGGWTAGRLKLVKPAPATAARCLIGGMLMGAGSVSIPGSNDGLSLVGLPLLLPYAGAALASMAVAIYLGMQAERRLSAL